MNFNPANLLWICPFCAALGWILHAFCAISGRQADHEDDESHARVRYAMQEPAKPAPRPEEIEAARKIVEVGGRMGDIGPFYRALDMEPRCGLDCPGHAEAGCDCLGEGEHTLAAARAWLASHGIPEEVPGTEPGSLERAR